ncbi:MAG: Brp/Blh family beta-carotene 15,15'-dioxygenase [Bacteroidota bacterium]
MLGDVFYHEAVTSKRLNKIIIAVTTIAILVCLTLPAHWVNGILTPFALLLILAGIPHGATDFVVFQRIFAKYQITQQLVYFLTGYFLAMFFYIVVWWFSPLTAFGLFLLNSVYHFGESNWNFLDLGSKVRQSLVYIVWGSAVLAVPILLHFEQAAIIIQEFSGAHLTISTAFKTSIICSLIVGNLLMIVSLFWAKLINVSRFYREIRNFLILMLLFFSTPLLVGFSIYFVFWHSLYAMRDQFKYLNLANEPGRKKAYIKQLFFISLVSFLALGGLYSFADGHLDQGYNLGKLFVFIAVVTVPHSLLMHNLYQFKVISGKKE